MKKLIIFLWVLIWYFAYTGLSMFWLGKLWPNPGYPLFMIFFYIAVCWALVSVTRILKKHHSMFLRYQYELRKLDPQETKVKLTLPPILLDRWDRLWIFIWFIVLMGITMVLSIDFMYPFELG